MKKKITILLLILFTVSISNAQNPEWINYYCGKENNVIVEESNFMWVGTSGGLVKINKLTNSSIFYNITNSGLPGNHVYSIAIDSLGNKWIGTGNGLAKFDGTTWTVYNDSNSGLPGNEITSIAIDGSGNKWIGAGEDGLAKFDGTSWTDYNQMFGLRNYGITSIAIDNSGTIWIGLLEEGGLVKFDGINWTRYDSYNSGLPGSYVNSIAIDSIGNKWIGTSYGMAKFDGINWTAYYPINYGMSSNTIRSLAIDKIGNKWIGIGDYLAKFDGINWTIYHTPYYMDDNGQINSIAIDSIGNKWIGTKDGLAIFNESTWNTLISSNSGLPSDYVRSMAIDGCGNKWIGTSNGLVKFDGTNWSVYNSSNNYSLQSQTTSIAMDGIGNKWIGTHDGLFKYDGTNWTNYNTSNSGLPNSVVRTIAIDRNENKWIGTSGGLVKYDGTTWNVYKTTNSDIPANDILSITIDDYNNKWIGTYYGGLAKFDGTNWTIYNTSNSGLPSNLVKSITIDNSGNKWVGTNNGLVKYDGSNWIVFNTMNSGLPNNEVNSIAIDGIGNKWIGTFNGLVKYDGINWTVYNTLNSKLPNNEVTSIAIDGNGNKWIGTYYYGGLAIFKEGGIFNIEGNPTKYTNIKLYLEGLYNTSNHQMTPAMNETVAQFSDYISDSITLQLAQPYFPFLIEFSYGAKLQTDGSLEVDIPCYVSGNYFLVVKHRNHIETWSAFPVAFATDTINYNFTTDASKATGDNQKLIDANVFGIYSGDVNQDGLVDGSDMSEVEYANNYFYVGYLYMDVNGDGLVDGSDMSLIEFNNNAFINVVQPYTTTAILTTDSVGFITNFSPTVYSNISFEGGAKVTEKGICWSTSPNPSISDNKTIVGNGTGRFVSNISGLTPNTTYFVRAYATNSVGTAYGNELSFTTAFLPTVTTDSITFITAISATSGGKISFDGGAAVTARGICWSTSPNPTIADYKTINGNGSGNFTIDITALKQNKKYYVRAYAVNYAGIAYGNEISFTTLPHIYPVYDIDSNGYDTVHIGTQVWMKQNLNTSRYNDGTTIPNISDNAVWSSLSSGARAYYNNDSLSYSYIYGAFYNWYTVNTGNLCPTGWHVPTDAEWTSLTTHLGGDSIAGGKLRATTLWYSPNTGTTNESGFTALPASLRYESGLFDNFFLINSSAYWWSSTENLSNSNQYAINRCLFLGSYVFRHDMDSKNKGYSVRCLKGDLARVSTDTVSGITFNSAIITGKIISDGGLSVTAKGVCWSKTPYPTTALNTKTIQGSGIGSFVSNITGLIPNTTYYVRAYATNSDGTVYGKQISFITLSHPVYDIDGNGYDTVQIGTQVWLKQNLNTSRYYNGTAIPKVTDNATWAGLNTGARSYYNNDSVANADTYGALYNWYAVNTGNLCPFGWHVPTDNEWTALVNYLGGTSIAGGKLKEAGLSHWNSPNTGATNSSGFTALAGGYRLTSGTYNFTGKLGYWWTSSESTTLDANRWKLNYDAISISKAASTKQFGFSVRCIKN